jgi:GNAT superfamily N-acetyltransferase
MGIAPPGATGLTPGAAGKTDDRRLSLPHTGAVTIQAESGVLVRGAEYLRLVTALLQRMRLASPTDGAWEAADAQWWARRERPTDAGGQLVWLDRRGEPEAAVILTNFGRSVQCDVLAAPDVPGGLRALWRAAIGRVTAVRTQVKFPVRPDDAAGRGELAAAGFAADPADSVVACWLAPADRPAVSPLPPGYRLLSWAGAPAGVHPLAARNGAQVEARLRECSLYRPELDLRVVAPDGQTAGYGLFWPDPVTGVGLVEPMRTEELYRGRGIASHILAAGLDGLARRGCRRLKVSSDLGLYLRAGFRPQPGPAAVVYTRPAG